METNCIGLYFEKNRGVFDKRTYYPANTKVKFMRDLSCTRATNGNPERLFWADDLMKNPFKTSEFYYAEINHPTMGKAIFGASRNRGYMWQFSSEKDLKASLRWSLGEQYKDMLKDGYIVIKKGHNKITAD